jgi:DNA polymerase II large subunit
VNHLQYMPPEEDMKVIAGNCPVCIDGDPTEDVEVSAYRGVPGVETDRVRGGVPLVMCEGVAAKAAKLLKYTKRLKLGWDWLEKIIKIKKKADKTEIKPDPTYLEGLVAGRPVFAHASAKGGFRLRYGRSKTNSLMGRNVHPATMHLLDNFLAYGTHMKVERPGKGCVVCAHDGLEPPVVKLKDGRVMKVRTLAEAQTIKDEVEEIIFLGDILCTYGDFLKSNHPLMPSGYCEEWWQREIESKGIQPPQTRDAPSMFGFSRLHGIPLHPDLTFHWHDLTMEQLRSLAQWLKSGHLEKDPDGRVRELSLPMSDAKRVLEELMVEHRVVGGNVVVESDLAFALLSSLGGLVEGRIELFAFDKAWDQTKSPLAFVNELSGIRIKPKAPTYIGARMGRPEKAKERAMEGSPNVLFPTGSFKNRSISKQCRTLKSREGEKTLNLELVRMRCGKCKRLGFSRKCDVCGERSFEERFCHQCGRSVESEIHCDRKTLPYDKRPIDIVTLFDSIKDRIGIGSEDVKGVKGISNPTRIPERLEKGFLRSKHGVFVFRDGTSRFDATDVPLTHFTPREIGLSIERAKELGYEKDYLDNPLERDDQLLSLRHQDIVLADAGAAYFWKVGDFIDDMLVNLYGLKSFYNIKRREDLIGHLAIGLSPHTSAGALCRIIGFTKATVGYGHPYFHTAKRRNCFHGDEKMLVDEGSGFRLVTMRELASRYLAKDASEDSFCTRYKEVSGLKTFAFNKGTKKFEAAPLTHISIHKAPSHLLELKTKSGRKITVTPDHAFPDRTGAKVKAEDVKELLIPWNIPCSPAGGGPEAFDLSEAGSDLMVRTEEEVFEEPLIDVSRSLGISYKTLTNYVYRNSYPLEMVRRFKPGLIDGGCIMSRKRDRVSLKSRIPVDDDFLSLLGMYLAEGYIRKRQHRSNQVTITAAKPWARDYLCRKIRSVFGVDAVVSGNAVTICSGLMLGLFRRLGIGSGAKTKRIPDFIYGLQKDKIAAFLRGYFAGDGSCSLGSTLEVNVTSVNRWLIDGSSVLLNMVGIRHSVQEESRLIKSGLVYDFYGRPKEVTEYKLRIYGEAAAKFINTVGFLDEKHDRALNLLETWLAKRGSCRAKLEGDAFVDPVVSRRLVPSTEENVYNVTVSPHHTLICSGITAFQCDGDEDCVMLLMDGLINFSRKYLNERRGGTMDTPLVLSMDINPKEVDDEAHNIEFVSRYPLEFYEAAERLAAPGDVKLKTVKDVLGTPEQFELPITHPGGSVDEGNCRTAYVLLNSIPEKIDIQFRLQERLRPVDQRDAAERLILSHFIPDLYGNLRSFSRQTFRCVNCNTIARRVPLAGRCSKCGGNLLLTINKGGIEKYLEISKDIVKRYELPDYLKQRLELVGKEIKSIFEDDKIKQTGLSDFL